MSHNSGHTPAGAAPPQDAAAGHAGPHELKPAPLDLTTPQFTIRAVLTGTALGALLSACNIYSGLTIGWGFNMSITAILISYGFWAAARRIMPSRVGPWTILENNINQAACSAGAAVSSAGLVAPIPALMLLRPEMKLSFVEMASWVAVVCLVGILAAVALRRQMIVVDKLAFPSGIACYETLREMYAEGSEAIRRVFMLLSAAVVASGVKLAEFIWAVPKIALPSWIKIQGFSPASLTISFDATLMMYAVGGIIGPRGVTALLVGAIFAWGILAPTLIHRDYIDLAIHEPLHRLPEGLTLPPRSAGGTLEYDAGRRRLDWRGRMSEEQRGELLSRSENPAFREAVQKLFVRSQISFEAPLPALPAGVSLANTPLRFDEKKRALIAASPIDRELHAKLRDGSSDAMFRTALDSLYHRFNTTTTRIMQISTPLEALPDDLILPRDTSAAVRFDRNRKALISVGPMTEADKASVVAKIDATRKTHPDQEAQRAATLAAVEKLYERRGESFLPAGVAIPAALAERVAYDDSRKALIARDVLTAAERKTLAELSKDEDFRAAAGSIAAGMSYAPSQPSFRDVTEWLLWPGVTLMVVSSLVAVMFNWRSFLNALPIRGRSKPLDPSEPTPHELSGRPLLILIAVVAAIAVYIQVSMFEITWWAAIISVMLAFVLALVATRVAGETNTTPVGAMGKVTQLIFAGLSPQNPAPNLMAANVTGGAASQCADLMHDLKTGYLLGASARYQAISQMIGAVVGSFAGTAVFMALLHDPQEQLFSEKWAAPAVAVWKAVAEIFMIGMDAIPRGTGLAMIIAASAGVLLPLAERLLPKKWKFLVLSPAGLGLAFVIQAHTCIAMFIGGMIAGLLGKFVPSWTGRFFIALCSGIVAGESLTGVGIAIEEIFKV